MEGEPKLSEVLRPNDDEPISNEEIMTHYEEYTRFWSPELSDRKITVLARSHVRRIEKAQLWESSGKTRSEWYREVFADLQGIMARKKLKGWN